MQLHLADGGLHPQQHPVVDIGGTVAPSLGRVDRVRRGVQPNRRAAARLHVGSPDRPMSKGPFATSTVDRLCLPYVVDASYTVAAIGAPLWTRTRTGMDLITM